MTLPQHILQELVQEAATRRMTVGNAESIYMGLRHLNEGAAISVAYNGLSMSLYLQDDEIYIFHHHPDWATRTVFISDPNCITQLRNLIVAFFASFATISSTSKYAVFE